MNCPYCHAKGKCVDSRPSSSRGQEYTRRRYTCPADHRWSSIEVAVADDGRQFESLLSALNQRFARAH